MRKIDVQDESKRMAPPCDKSVRYAGCFLMSSIFWLKTKKTGKTNIF